MPIDFRKLMDKQDTRPEYSVVRARLATHDVWLARFDITESGRVTKVEFSPTRDEAIAWTTFYVEDYLVPLLNKLGYGVTAVPTYVTQ